MQRALADHDGLGVAGDCDVGQLLSSEQPDQWGARAAALHHSGGQARVLYSPMIVSASSPPALLIDSHQPLLSTSCDAGRPTVANRF